MFSVRQIVPDVVAWPHGEPVRDLTCMDALYWGR